MCKRERGVTYHFTLIDYTYSYHLWCPRPLCQFIDQHHRTSLCTHVVFTWPEKLLFRTIFLQLFSVCIMDTWILGVLGLKEGSCFSVEYNIQVTGRKLFICNKP